MDVMSKNATEIENASWRVPVILGLLVLMAIKILSVHFMTIFTEKFNTLADTASHSSLKS